LYFIHYSLFIQSIMSASVLVTTTTPPTPTATPTAAPTLRDRVAERFDRAAGATVDNVRDLAETLGQDTLCAAVHFANGAALQRASRTPVVRDYDPEIIRGLLDEVVGRTAYRAANRLLARLPGPATTTVEFEKCVARNRFLGTGVYQFGDLALTAISLEELVPIDLAAAYAQRVGVADAAALAGLYFVFVSLAPEFSPSCGLLDRGEPFEIAYRPLPTIAAGLSFADVTTKRGTVTLSVPVAFRENTNFGPAQKFTPAVDSLCDEVDIYRRFVVGGNAMALDVPPHILFAGTVDGDALFALAEREGHTPLIMREQVVVSDAYAEATIAAFQ
jgi:hypothetical protein